MYEHLYNQLAALSLGYLSPNLISPSQLWSILLTISSELPPLNTLPFYYETDIFNYYKYLPLTGVVENNKIMVIVKIPINEQYEQYKNASNH